MGSAANQAKTRWNAKKYRQVKFSIDPDIAAAFKAACSAAGSSMAGAVSQFMAEYSKAAKACKAPTGADFSTRKKRRQAVSRMISQLEQIMDAEEGYMEAIPENLRNSVRYESAEESISSMEDALDKLAEIY